LWWRWTTACTCFGGDNLDTLYVTSATAAPKPGQATPASMEGGLLALHVGVRGLPEAAFAG
jgi:sugar lactone lactonase YvrE